METTATAPPPDAAERVARFRDVAGDDLDADTCEALLASNDWDVEATIRHFFEPPQQQQQPSPPPSQQQQRPGEVLFRNDDGSNDDDDDSSNEDARFIAENPARFRDGVFPSDDPRVRARRNPLQQHLMQQHQRRSSSGVGDDGGSDGSGEFPQGGGGGARRIHVPPPQPPLSIVNVLREFLFGQPLNEASSAWGNRKFLAEFDRVTAGCAAHPQFLECAFDNALQTAASERKLLVVYLHASLHPRSDTFCREVLCAPAFLAGLGDARLWGGCTDCADAYVVSSKLNCAGFPSLVLLSLAPSTSEAQIVDRIYLDQDVVDPAFVDRVSHRVRLCRTLTAAAVGTTNQNAPDLLASRGGNSAAQQRAAQREVDERRRVVQEQDAALRQAMEEDRKALEAKRAREREEEEERQRQKSEDEARAQELSVKRSRIGGEPEKGMPETATLKFNFPGGSRLVRRFRGSDTVAQVRDVVDVHAADQLSLPKLRYSLTVNYPKRTLEDETMTLKDAGLLPDAAVFVQDLDA